jgi:hypothetical protein
MQVTEKKYNQTTTFGKLKPGDTFKYANTVWMKTENVSNMQTKINAVVLTTGTFDQYFKDTDTVGVITGSFVEG